MKKISFLSLDIGTLQWLDNILQNQDSDVESIKELHHAVRTLLNGESDSLMMELGEKVSFPIENGLTYGDLTIDVKSRRVVRDGIEVKLTPKEFDILYFLAKNCGEVFTKEQIYQAVWSEAYYTTDSNIMAFIRKLRKKIEPNPDAPQYILTIWGIGYKFNDRL